MILGSALFGLFLAAFVAATLIPFQSEIIFAGMIVAEPERFGVILLVASVGNVLGSCLNYALGRGLMQLRVMERFRIPEEALRRAEAWFRRWGVWSLLLSWLPLGDVLTVVAGTLRTPFWLFALLVTIAKTGRYLVLGLITLGFVG
ncbi:MAG: DedA family protein [Rhodobacteraceae bacterium]|jgi:membrane protein YqaA with SNARE-associated domain|nr:DedA family protein [Paracoccaceae bacterium]MCZ8082243.1 DedA family protein [Paracoccaceae bacterium]